jgi:hypothetical protein
MVFLLHSAFDSKFSQELAGVSLGISWAFRGPKLPSPP